MFRLGNQRLHLGIGNSTCSCLLYWRLMETTFLVKLLRSNESFLLE